jgi:hypothetical protein
MSTMHAPGFRLPSFKAPITHVTYEPQAIKAHLFTVTLTTGETYTTPRPVGTKNQAYLDALTALGYTIGNRPLSASIVQNDPKPIYQWSAKPRTTNVPPPEFVAWMAAKAARIEADAAAEQARAVAQRLAEIERAKVLNHRIFGQTEARSFLTLMRRVTGDRARFAEDHETAIANEMAHDTIEDLMGATSVYDPTENFAYGDRNERISA